MDHVMKIAWVVAVLLTTACGGGGSSVDPTPTPNPTPDLGLKVYTTATAAGSLFYLETTASADAVEVRVDNLLMTERTDIFEGATYRLPDTVAPGTVTVGVRRNGEAADTLTYPLTVAEPLFEDVAQRMGLAQEHDNNSDADACMPVSTGLGVADVDGDGLIDVYAGNLGSPGKLWLNRDDTDQDGLPNFEAVALPGLAGIDNISAVSFVDFDNDGDADLLLGRWGTDVLLRNQLVETGTPGFVDVTQTMGLTTTPNRTAGIAWGDYDGDGDLDVYLVRHTYCGLGGIDERNPYDQLFRNDGDSFTDTTYLLGDGTVTAALGFAAVWVDYDQDGDQDLLVANDYISGAISHVNALWRNDGPDPDQPGGRLFTEVGEASGFGPPLDEANVNSARDTVNAMGISIADIDGDGYPDVTMSNIGPNLLMRNRGDGTFEDISVAAGIQRTDLPWGLASITWGTQFLDFDNDMDVDIFYAGGRIDVGNNYPNAFFRNEGVGVPFSDMSWASGLADMHSGKSSAFVDLDRDGFVEFLVANYDGPLRAYRNRCPDLGVQAHWLQVVVRGQGVPGKSNRDGIGAVVRVTTPDGKTQTGFQTSKPSLGSGGQLLCHFGLGDNTSVTHVTVTWPTGAVTQHTVDGVDRRILVEEP